MNMYQYKDLDFIKKTDTKELLKSHLKTVFDTYYQIFGEVCTGCPSEIEGYILKLKRYQKPIKMENDTREFQLKKGVIIPVMGTSKAYSAANITDEVSLNLLKENPNRRSLFLKVPDNLEELLSEELEEKELEDYSATELRELYPSAKGRSKDDLILDIKSTTAETNEEE
ncbi:hypothetical protein [Tenacibaculum piscium]|uniref:hypothetical protein n=1 Tax=Tenacibaculum piscium TaxID=1458515 RepID=UPI00187B7071|nr:hypothetical protein [Tenacibaculum piscium]MBE7691139.1 hypothetical protein [Tenacibaculum piscium]